MIVYKTNSFIQVLFSWLFRIGYICVATIALLHYDDNPIVTLVIAFICILFFLTTGKDEITIYSDTIEYKSNSIIKIISRKKIFSIKDIAKIDTSGIFSTGDELYNPTISKDKPLNELRLELKNGNVVTIKTSIYIDSLKRVEAEVNELLKKTKGAQ